MQIKVFTIPAFDSEGANEELNIFLRSKRVLEVQQEFVAAQNGAYWCYSVKYILGENKKNTFVKKEKKDYRVILDKKNFETFEELRKYRKELAEKYVVPAYAVFTDAELAEIAKLSAIKTENIAKIKGIGEKKTEKYGKLIAKMYQENEANRKSDSQNS